MAKRKRNKEAVPTVQEVPVTCPYCQSPRRSYYGAYRLPERPMTLPTGELHTGVVVRYAECDDCRRRYRVKAPLMDARN